MIQRLPTRLQECWRDVADLIINIQQREVTIEDIARFVEERSRALSNPIFGKMQTSGVRDSSKQQVRNSKSPL